MNVSESKSAVRSEINVTPLVDVCLVLLIIFMVVTPLITKQVDVQLPQTPGPGKFPPSELIQVTIQESGSIWIGDRLVPRELLASTLRDMAPTDKPVAVAGDGRLRYREVRLVLELIQQAGFQRVGLIAERQGA